MLSVGPFGEFEMSLTQRLKNPVRLALLVAASLATPALAQDLGTQGPEGSEVGKGGYTSPSGSRRFSATFHWGASFQESSPLSGTPGAPIFVGLSGSWWSTDWFVLDATFNYLLNSSRIEGLVGPRFRTSTWPVSGGLGVQAGLINTPGIGPRFGIVPSGTVDFTIDHRVVLGLSYFLDLAFGAPVGHRIGMNIGYRF
jgi:hypothetical protein